jgi:ubiquitin-activating enzyme E1 C
MVLSLLQYDDNGQLDPSSIIPLVDGGTEGFKGHARVILAGLTACMDCTMDLYPPQVRFHLWSSNNTICIACQKYQNVFLQWHSINANI